MNIDLIRAKALLASEGYTCVLQKDDIVYTSTQRGIAPLMHWLADGIDLRGYSAADKVVGKAAAYLYVLLCLEEVYAYVISRPALDVLTRYDIAITYGELVPAIRNRTDTGFCPMESAVLSIDNAREAYGVLKGKLAEMQKGESSNAGRMSDL